MSIRFIFLLLLFAFYLFIYFLQKRQNKKHIISKAVYHFIAWSHIHIHSFIILLFYCVLSSKENEILFIDFQCSNFVIRLCGTTKTEKLKLLLAGIMLNAGSADDICCKILSKRLLKKNKYSSFKSKNIFILLHTQKAL